MPLSTIDSSGLSAAGVAQTNLAANVAGNGPAFAANTSGGQSFTNLSNNRITYSSEAWDLGGCYNNTGSTVTLNGVSVPAYSFGPNVAGYYYITYGIVVSANTTAGGEIILQLRKNSTVLAWANNQYASATHYNGLCGTNLVYLNGTTDTVDMNFYNSSGGTTSVASDAYTYFQAFLARSA